MLQVQAVLAGLTDAERVAFTALCPADGTALQKHSQNCFSCEDAGPGFSGFSGICLLMARVNHTCVGNCNHTFLSQHGCKVLVAGRPVATGDEITISYCPLSATGSQPPLTSVERRKHLFTFYGFDCACLVCTTASGQQRAEALVDANVRARAARQCGDHRQAVTCWQDVHELEQAMHCDALIMAYTCAELVNSAACNEQMAAAAHKHALLAADLGEGFFGAETSFVVHYRRLAASFAVQLEGAA
jgi:hypothetical protein